MSDTKNYPSSFQALFMKAPRSLKITDLTNGTGPSCEPGDLAICHCRCTRSKGDLLFESNPDTPYEIRIGARDSFVAIEYGLLGMRAGGQRQVVAPPNLTVDERKTYPDLPDGAMLIYELTLLELPSKWDPDMAARLAANQNAQQ